MQKTNNALNKDIFLIKTEKLIQNNREVNASFAASEELSKIRVRLIDEIMSAL